MTACSISIVVPAYNVEAYLGEALDSIKRQTEAPDELVIIDDGSTDSTLEIANSYSFPFPYKVVPIENAGQGNARNLGVDLASSEYLYFFDSDDILNENFVSTVRAKIKSNNEPDIILFSGESFNDSGYSGDRWIDYVRGFSGYFSDRLSFLEKGTSSNGLFCQPCLYVSKKKIWGDGKLRFASNYYEDEAIFFPVLFACNSFFVMDDVFFYRRNREGSTMTMTLNIKHVNGSLNCMKTLMNLYQRRDLAGAERTHLINRLCFYCVNYIVTARKVGVNISYKEVLKALFVTKSFRLLTRVSFYVLRADQIKTVRNFVRSLKRTSSV